MTIELNREQQAMLDEVLGDGPFEDAEQFLDHALTMALSESRAFNDHARLLLAEAQEAKGAGRVVHVPQGELPKLLRERTKR